MLNPTRPKTRTFEGAPARRKNPHEELALLTVGTFLTDKFYESAGETLHRLHALVGVSSKEFVLKLARVARTEFNMRTSPAVLLASYTLHHGQPDDMSIFLRGDEILDYLAAVSVLSDNKKVTPSAVRFGRKVLQETLTERKALRYARSSRVWSLSKAIRLTHAMSGASDKQKALFRYVINKNDWGAVPEDLKELLPYIAKVEAGEETPSWERSRSAGASWNELVRGMGYMALLRNLRNFCEDDLFEEWNFVIDKISSQEEVEKSQQFPFRFLSALRELPHEHYVYHRLAGAIHRAIEYSIPAVPKLSGSTVVIVDTSASMGAHLSQRSRLSPEDIAALFAGILAKYQDADVIAFATDAQWVDYSRSYSIFSIMNSITSTDVGYATNIDRAFGLFEKEYDNVIILSDMQVSRYFDYNGNSRVFSVDLQGYSPGLSLQGNVYSIGGWSDATIKLIATAGNIVNHVEGA